MQIRLSGGETLQLMIAEPVRHALRITQIGKIFTTVFDLHHDHFVARHLTMHPPFAD